MTYGDYTVGQVFEAKKGKLERLKKFMCAWLRLWMNEHVSLKK
jgi:hypothetical protein